MVVVGSLLLLCLSSWFGTVPRPSLLDFPHLPIRPPPPPLLFLVALKFIPNSGISVYSCRISEIVSDADLKFLIEKLDQKLNESEKWEQVIDKRNNLLSYNAKCCKPKDGPLKYLSVTVFENCSPEMLKNFYMDNDYRKQWDKTVVEHEQLQVDKINGVEIGRTIKKFPLLTPREYVLAWRLWEGKDKTFYCFLKECEHPSVPRQKKFVRVRFFRSVPGRNACEIKMFHQEDAGLNVEMAKLAFAKGIWSYVCKMDSALRKYSGISHPQSSSAVTLIQKVPPGLDTMNRTSSESTSATAFCGQTGEAKERKISKRPSRKLLANGLLLLGGAICLSRGHSSLGAKVAMAYILTKLSKHGASSDQSSQS
ncbi:star-related lipid transfer protein 7 [Quercus suber]|uniref:Star-related lipid transfer protein 7 n=1 Tax=Quercus suber TaxID=58331 RepID=A0AAW0KXX6_QUESU